MSFDSHCVLAFSAGLFVAIASCAPVDVNDDAGNSQITDGGSIGFVDAGSMTSDSGTAANSDAGQSVEDAGTSINNDAGTAFDGDAGTAAGNDAGVTASALLPPSRSPVLQYCPFDDAVDLTRFEGRPVIRVCHPQDARAGCDETSISAAINRANSGDRIEIVGDGAPYFECAVIPDTAENLELVGVCGRAKLQDVVCQRKGILLNLGRNITLSHLEISGAEISEMDGGNAAALRDQGLGGLNLRYVYFHDNQNGILGGKGVVHIDWSKFERNGGAADPGFTHNTYFSADVTDVVIRNSLFLRAANEGNNMKSRAQRFEFFCSVTASLDGVDSREMDLSEGGELVIVNSIIQQGPESANSNMIGFASEAGNPARRHGVQSVRIQNTDFLNDRNNGTFLSYNAFNDVELNLADLRFVGPGTPLNKTNEGAETLVETNLETFADRSSAGLSPYSTDHFQLPLPRGCPDFEYF